jgi:hypothetical protein
MHPKKFPGVLMMMQLGTKCQANSEARNVTTMYTTIHYGAIEWWAPVAIRNTCNLHRPIMQVSIRILYPFLKGRQGTMLKCNFFLTLRSFAIKFNGTVMIQRWNLYWAYCVTSESSSMSWRTCEGVFFPPYLRSFQRNRLPSLGRTYYSLCKDHFQ